METGLARLFVIWHPRYRLLIGQLLLAGTLAAGLVYVQNTLLTNLTLSLTSSPSSPQGTATSFLGHLSADLNVGLPLFILLLFIIGNLLAAVLEYWKIKVIGILRIKTRNDIETEILMHLLDKEDFFFARHPPAETVNRITVDLNRVCELRCLMMRIWCSAGLVLSYIFFFISKDWRLGLAVIGSCAASAAWTYRLTRRIKHLDRVYLHQDDRVKSRFEDFLRAAPEVQVGGLYGRVRRDFQSAQDERTGTYLRFLTISGFLRAVDALSPLAAIACTILVVIYMQHTGQGSLALALLPVMIMSLPPLFQNASDLIFLNVDAQLAYTSRDRLLEYETRERPQAAPDHPVSPRSEGAGSAAPDVLERRSQPAAALRMNRVSYLYNGPDRNRQGGVAGIEAEFLPGKWIALAGRAGSGKTTLLNILTGRLQPQEGSVLYGAEPISSDGNRSEIFSLMPQSPALLNDTIRENLLFDSVDESGRRELTPADMELLELAGLGGLCRLKALDMLPGNPSDHATIQGRIAGIRGRARAHFESATGCSVLPYEDGRLDPGHWVLEILLGGKCDRRQAIRFLGGDGDCRSLRAFSQTGPGAALAEMGGKLLFRTRDLLQLPNFYQYSQNAAACIDEPVWKLRTALAGVSENGKPSRKEPAGLCAVALTCTAAECADRGLGNEILAPGFLRRISPESRILQDIMGRFWQPFSLDEIHPYLTWRENLAFGVVERLPEQVVLDFLEQEKLSPLFTRLGLEFNIGRMGGSLSGGQGQLLALCRALLRRTPVLILDEPTSHQDPIGSARLARLLQSWKTNRIIITVSHDPHFVSKADEVYLLDGGRIAARGAFEQILSSSEIFRNTLWDD